MLVFISITVVSLIVLLFLYVTGLGKKWLFAIHQRNFAIYMTYAAKKYELELKERKAINLASLCDMTSADPELRAKKQIRILEIGAGSGTNFKYYPKGSQLIMLDINDKFKEALTKNVEQYPDLCLENYLVADAADMHSIADGTVDAVIGQYVLCSCSNVPQVLKEIHRVLQPNGRFYFLEHVVDKHGTKRRQVQEFLVNSGIWGAVACGCSVAKDTASFIRNAEFSKIELENFYLNTERHFVFHITRPTIIGIAEK